MRIDLDKDAEKPLNCILYINPGDISKENEIGCSAILLSVQTEEVNLSE